MGGGCTRPQVAICLCRSRVAGTDLEGGKRFYGSPWLKSVLFPLILDFGEFELGWNGLATRMCNLLGVSAGNGWMRTCEREADSF